MQAKLRHLQNTAFLRPIGPFLHISVENGPLCSFYLAPGNLSCRRTVFLSPRAQVKHSFPPWREGSKIARDGAQRNPGTAAWSRFRAPYGRDEPCPGAKPRLCDCPVYLAGGSLIAPRDRISLDAALSTLDFALN